MRPGRVLFGGLAVLYLLAYLRGSALLVAATATVGWLLWRARRTGRRATGGDGWPGWAVDDGRVATGPLATEVLDAGGWQMAPLVARLVPTVVHGVPEPLAAGQPVGFGALVELRDAAGRQALLQVEAAYPADLDLERLIRQAVGQAARRAGWQLERWQPVTDAAFAPAASDGAGEWRW